MRTWRGCLAPFAAMLVAAVLLQACSESLDIPVASPPSTTLGSQPAAVEPTDSTDAVAVGELSTDEEVRVLDDVVLPEFSPPDRSAELAMQLADGGEPTLQNAIDVFNVTYLPMPGATPSDLPVGGGLGNTYALRLIESKRAQLTPEQLTVLDSLDEGAIEVGTFGGDGLSRTAPVPPLPPGGALDATGALAAEVLKDWRTHRPDLPKVVLRLDVQPNFALDRAADAWPLDDGTCRVRLYAPNLEFNPSFDDSRFWRYTIAHELFHCIQFELDPAWGNKPPWLIEGSADWAAFDLYRSTTTPTPRDTFMFWFFRQDYPLVAPAYDAWPLYESLLQWGRGDVYAAIKAMFAAGGGTQSLLAAGGMIQDEFLASWTSLSTRLRKYDEPEWTLNWPGPLPLFGPHDLIESQGPRGVGTYNVIGTGQYSHKPVVVTMLPDVGYVTVEPQAGPLRTHAMSGTVTIPAFNAVRFCFVGDGCVCPGDSTGNTIQMDERDMTFAFAAGASTPTAVVTAKKWDPDKECKPKKKPVGESNGDPHLVTFDGMAYDVMARGEFVLTRDDTAGEFEVQQRHEPFGFGTGTTAVAVGSNGHRATITSTAGTAQNAEVIVRVDGDEVDAGASVEFGGVILTPDGDGDDWTLAWPDGTVVEVSWRLGFFVRVLPTTERAADLVGLLGKFDGIPVNDLVTPSGEQAIAGATSDATFAPQWQVTESTTLFDYQPGESVDSFVTPPPAPGPPPTDEVIDMCRAALGAAANEHDVRSCSFDITSTGDEGFATIYAEVAADRGTVGTVSVDKKPTSTLPSGEPAPNVSIEGTVYDGFSPVDDPTALAAISGVIDLSEGTVVVARAESCPPGIEIDAVLVQPETRAETTIRMCDTEGFNASGSDDVDEVVAGESYALVTKGGVYEARIVTSSEEPIFVRATLMSDATPAVLDPDEFLESGYSGTLQGVADTVYLPMRTGELFVTWPIVADAPGVLCANYSYAADPIGEGGAIGLGYCGHPEAIGTTPTQELVVTAVLFSRTEQAVEVSMEPVVSD